MFISNVIIYPGDGINVVNFIDIVIHDQYRLNNIKIIRTNKGRYHLVFPSKKIEKRCIHCKKYNKQSANFCNDCGGKLSPEQQEYADIFFPICIEARQKMEERFLVKYKVLGETLYEDEIKELVNYE